MDIDNVGIMSDATSTVTIEVMTVTPVHAGRLLGLADVELTLDGVAILIHGIQIRADGHGTEIALPRYRAPDGSWLAAMSLPDDIRAPMGDAVIAAGIDAGILRQR